MAEKYIPYTLHRQIGDWKRSGFILITMLLPFRKGLLDLLMSPWFIKTFPLVFHRAHTNSIISSSNNLKDPYFIKFGTLSFYVRENMTKE